MPRLRALAAAWLASRRPAVVVSVDAARGSVPRESGTRMLVAMHETAGTIGGGQLELKAITLAHEMLRAGDVHAHTEHYPLGPALGQCCGGAVTLGYVPLDADALAHWPIDPPRFHLQLYGAGHVGRAIAQGLAPLNVLVDWIDEREEEFPTAFHQHAGPWPEHIRKVCVDSVEAEVRIAPPGAYYLVLTHRHDLDLRIGEAILQRGDFGFFGLIGSATKRQRFIHHFERRGLAWDRMTCPIGLPGIEGKEPEVIAAAVVAQLLSMTAARRGTSAFVSSASLIAPSYSASGDDRSRGARPQPPANTN